jgi:hypothetical protein
LHEKDQQEEDFSRKGAKKTFRNAAALCAFAPLREKQFLFIAPPQGYSVLFVQSRSERIKSLFNPN